MEKAHLTVLDIVGPDGRFPSLGDNLKISLEKATSQVGPAIVVCGTAAATKPGTYTVWLTLSGTVKDGEPARIQPISLNLQRAAPQVVSLQPLTLWQGWDSGSAVSDANSLVLREQSWKAAARGIICTDIPDTSDPPRQQTAVLQVSSSNAVIEPGQDVRWPVTINGTFPLGKTTGRIEVRGYNMPAPVTVNYQVYARRHPAWIAVCLFVGSFVGFFVRIFLQNKRELLQSKEAAWEILASLQKTAGEVKDAAFLKSIGTIRKNLQDACENENSATIKAAAVAARDGLTSALADLERRRQAFEMAFSPLRALLEQNWNLPPLAAGLLAEARQRRDEIAAFAGQRDIDSAQKWLDGGLQEKDTQLVDAALRWRHHAGNYLKQLAENPPALPDNGPVILTQAVSTWVASYGGDFVSKPSVTLEMLAKELNDAHAARGSAINTVQDVSNAEQAITEWLARLMPPSSSATFASLRELVAGNRTAIIRDLDDPGEHLDAPADRQTRERNAWYVAFEVATNAGEAKLKPVKEALDSGKWSDAARLAGTLLPKVLPTAGIPLDKSGSQTPGSPEPPQAGAIALRIDLPVGKGVESITNPLALTGSLTEQTALRRAGKFAASIQGAIFFLILVAVAYVIYLPAWIGTFKEMFGLFAWAFALDLTADSILPILARVTPTPKV